MLQDMVLQYRQLAPVFAELGYIGDGYNKSGRNGDVQFAVSNILREIKDVPQELQRLDPKTAPPTLFDPHNVFKNCGLFRAGNNETEVNAFLTSEQRKLVTWAQTQIHRYSVYDMIDEATVSAALKPENIDSAEKGLVAWRKYIDRALAATEQPSLHLATGAKLDKLIGEMKALFSIDDKNFDNELRYFEKHMETFNALSNFDQYILKAEGAKAEAKAILKKPLLTIEDAVLFLRGIDPHIALTGALKVSEPAHDTTALYKERTP